MAWLLSEIRLPAGARLPGGVDAAALEAWMADLVRRLRRAAVPQK